MTLGILEKKRGGYGVDDFALVICRPEENKCETEFPCIDVNKIYNCRMLVDPKLHGPIYLNVCYNKSYKKLKKHWLAGF